MAFLRRVALRRVVSLPRRESWHGLQEFTLKDADQVAFRDARNRDTIATTLIQSTQAQPPKPIDWKQWEDTIAHKDMVTYLKDFHASQVSMLDNVLKEDSKAIVESQKDGWALFDAAVKSCEKSVEKSKDIVKNGARALFISHGNPSISLVNQNEWLDTDQYWQAFVEKHQYYHDHLCSVAEDPESKEYDQKQEQDLLKRWAVFDGKSVNRHNNKLLYQRPSHEYYDLYRGPLVEHMIFYLTKTGGDSRFFPELMPSKWFCEIYDIRFKIYNALQRRKREMHVSSMAREMHHDMHPHDLEHDGETHFAKLIARENSLTELQTARLMGNYILFSDDTVPCQTMSAVYRAMDSDGGKGSFFKLGDDVNCLFYKPAGGVADVGPVECFHAIMDHLALTGRKLPVAYSAALESFCEVLETRKEGLDGSWFTAPGESSRDAFMRRLKKADPAHQIFEVYAEEHKERWTNATAVPMEKVLEEMPEVERKYRLECELYDSVLFAMNDEFSGQSKIEQEKLTKLAEAGELDGLLEAGGMITSGAEKMTGAALVANVEAFEESKERAAEGVMATKTPMDRLKK